MAAEQRPVVDDLGNIAVHGRSGLVLVVKIETSTSGVYEDISASDLFFEISGKLRLALSAGADIYSRQVILTRAQVATLSIGQPYAFAIHDETPSTPSTPWAGTITTFGFKTAPTGVPDVDGEAANWTGATVVIQPGGGSPVVVVNYMGQPGEGVPIGGTAGQYLRKASSTDYAVGWDTITADDVSGLSATLSTLTSADVSLASRISTVETGYLPLAGGTMAGALTMDDADFTTNAAVRILQTYSEDHGHFSFETAGATYGGIKDPQLSVGYNRYRVFATEPSFTVNMEVDYLSGGVLRTMEYYLQYKSADNLTQKRPFMFAMDRDNDEVHFGFINVGTSGFTFQSTDLATNLAKFTNTEVRLHRVGIGTNSEYVPKCTLDVNGVVRSVNSDGTVTGAGLEMRWVPGSSKGRIISVDWDDAGGTYRDLDIECNTAAFVMRSGGVVETNRSTFRMKEQRTPASATATGVKGDFCHDSNYAYFCIATNTWKRVALSTW